MILVGFLVIGITHNDYAHREKKKKTRKKKAKTEIFHFHVKVAFMSLRREATWPSVSSRGMSLEKAI